MLPPLGIGIGIAVMMAAPMIVRRVRPAFVIGASLVVATAGFAVLTQIGDDGGLAVVVTGLVLAFAGLMPVSALGVDVVLSAAPPERAGAASAVSETTQEFGGALGLAILGSIATAIYRGRVAEAGTAGVPTQAAEAARDTLGGATGVAEQLPPALLATAADAFTEGLRLAAGVSAVTLAGVAIGGRDPASAPTGRTWLSRSPGSPSRGPGRRRSTSIRPSTRRAVVMAEHGKILVTGATGNVGRQLVAQLAASGADVRAIVRNPDGAGLPPGVEVVRGDLSDPASLEEPLRDVDAVFLMWPFLDAEGAVEVLDVITRHARRVVYLSAAGVDLDLEQQISPSTSSTPRWSGRWRPPGWSGSSCDPTASRTTSSHGPSRSAPGWCARPVGRMSGR